MQLRNWISMAREHWEEYLPEKFAALKEAGTLEQTLQQAAEQTYREIDELENSGFRPHEAEEIVFPKYLLLPPEPETEEPFESRPGLSLMMEIAELQNHATKAMNDPDYEIPDPPEN